MQKIKLICLPYAGASATCYYKWRPFLNSYIELVPIELAGRGRRLGEPHYNTFMQAVSDIASLVIPEIETPNPYILFGHSMGSSLVYELSMVLTSMGYHAPNHIVFSGRLPPEENEDAKQLYLSSDEELKMSVKEMGGTNAEIINSKEFQEYFINILRADYKILSEYISTNGSTLDCDISIFLGDDDPSTPLDQMQRWDKYTKGECSFYSFPGHHFFINNSQPAVIDTLNYISSKYFKY